MKERNPWDLPDAERRRLQEGRLRERVIRYYAPREPRLMEGLFSFLRYEKRYPLRLAHKIIDRLASITLATTVMSYPEIVEFIRGLPEEFAIARGPCACRLHTAVLGPDARDLAGGNLEFCRASPLDVDIQIATCGEEFGKLPAYRRITRQELLELEVQCRDMGLVANVYTMLSGDAGICHCSSRTCVPFLANEAIGKRSAFLKRGRRIARTDPSRCTAHGRCVQACHFQARRIAEVQGRAVSVLEDPSRCYGCGLCEAVCPEGAITMQERGPGRSREVPPPPSW
jgi:NAD-dependent dihydropyrimidine dehydrogenase PreA subunit